MSQVTLVRKENATVATQQNARPISKRNQHDVRIQQKADVTTMKRVRTDLDNVQHIGMRFATILILSSIIPY